MAIDCMCYSFCPQYKTKKCNSRCLKHLELTHLLKTSGIPAKKRELVPLIESPEDSDVIKCVRDISINIVDTIKSGSNILFWSEKTGNGKTTMAINLMLSYFNEVWAGNGFRTRGYFLYVPTYLNRCKDNMSKFDDALVELKYRAIDDDLLILDDLGATKLSEYDVSVISNIINERLLNEKSIITTTNCNKEQLASLIGDRLIDRLWSTSMILHLKSDSLRGIM